MTEAVSRAFSTSSVAPKVGVTSEIDDRAAGTRGQVTVNMPS